MQEMVRERWETAPSVAVGTNGFKHQERRDLFSGLVAASESDEEWTTEDLFGSRDLSFRRLP